MNGRTKGLRDESDLPATGINAAQALLAAQFTIEPCRENEPTTTAAPCAFADVSRKFFAYAREC